ITEEISNLEELISRKEENKISCAQEIEEIDQKLAENEDVRIVQEKIKTETDLRNLHVRIAKDKKDEMKNELITNGYH
ncbi:hypothetical protein, partial [Pseudomonas sp. 2822-17]|uniref:hypothetical protein n=1 Tax=Pseudomonas sp. 2822-17 TaxID=1712678 RepID=UPI001304661B